MSATGEDRQAMSEEVFKQYRRSQIAEMADWHEGFDMARVSVSAPDLVAGSPKVGDKIARNPKNHDDRWLVAAAYFADNFEELTANIAVPAGTSGTVYVSDQTIQVSNAETSL